jgi:hypothetical protein
MRNEYFENGEMSISSYRKVMAAGYASMFFALLSELFFIGSLMIGVINPVSSGSMIAAIVLAILAAGMYKVQLNQGSNAEEKQAIAKQILPALNFVIGIGVLIALGLLIGIIA